MKCSNCGFENLEGAEFWNKRGSEIGAICHSCARRTLPAAISAPSPLDEGGERKGDLISQIFYYNGKMLTLSNPSVEVYAIW